jgi:hypothetical protein
LTRTLANLICDEPNPLGTALKDTYGAPDELRTALTQVQEILTGDRDPAAFEAQLATTGYVVDSLQAGLFYGLTAESLESAIVQAVNSGGDTDTVGAIAGAVAGPDSDWSTYRIDGPKKSRNLTASSDWHSDC